MDRIPLKRKWWPFYLACGFALLLEVMYLAITWREYASLGRREIVLTHLIVIGIGVALCLYTVFHMLPELSAEGIWRRGFFNATYVRWQDVTDVSIFSFGAGLVIDVRTRTRKIRVIPGFYQNPEAIISTINQCVPKQALNSLGESS